MMLNVIQIQILLGAVWEMGCAPRAFVLIPEQKIWQEAQSYCRDKHLDLATVQSDEDRSMIQEAADDQDFDSLAWIGLFDGLNTWIWSYRKQAIRYKCWLSGEPDRSRTQGACAFITVSGEWSDSSCDVTRSFICYQVIVTNMEWEAWIGLSRNVWLWSDGTDASHPAMTWIDTQPDNLDGSESCGYVRADGAMGDDVCSIPRPFFCTQMRKRQTLMVSVNADDNVTEFTVMAAVEEKINQVLSMKGMDVGSNVTLKTHSEEIFYDDITEESTEPCEEEPSSV